MFAASGSVVFTRRYCGSKISGCDSVVNSTSPVLVREMLNENGEAVYVKLSFATCKFMFGSAEGRGKTDSGTS